MNRNFSKEIIGIKELNLLFFNYSQEMLEEMLDIREFKHCWENYIDLNKLTYMQLWEVFLTKISYKTQIRLLEIAVKYYGEEATKSFDNAVVIDDLVKKHISEK